jgi:hypothetical protein
MCNGKITPREYPIDVPPLSTLRSGAGHSTSTFLTLREPAKLNCGGTPASPG